jgi:hypothetical protein
MDLKQVGISVSGNIKKFICYTTNLLGGFPPSPGTDCGIGSTCIVLDSATKSVADIFQWDGIGWYKF